jgi:MATE family multidrug resistance protein
MQARDNSQAQRDDAPPAWLRRPFRELVHLAWPIALSLVSYAVMTLVDTLFVGRLGPAALAGVGLGGVTAFSLMVFSFGLLRAVKVHVSQAVGARRADQVQAYLGAGILVALGLGAASVLLGQLVAEVLPRVAASPQAGAYAQEYLRVRISAAPLVLVYVALREHRYGCGDSRSPMFAVLTANAVNFVLDWVLILEVELGPAGPAWASVAGHAVECVLLLTLQWRHGLGLRVVRRVHVQAVWRVGLATGVQFLLEMGAFSVMAVLIAAYSDLQMAAHQIALQAVHFTFLPAVAVAEATSVLAGRAIGGNHDPWVRPIAHRALLLVFGYGAVCALILTIGSRHIAGQFTTDPELIAAAASLLQLAALFQFSDAGQVLAGSCLRGTGDVRVPAVIGVVCAWLITPPLTWWLAYRMELGALGGWLALSVDFTVLSVLLWWRLERGHWHGAAARSRETHGRIPPGRT